MFFFLIIFFHSLPVFEEDGFPSQLRDGIKAQHGVTSLRCVRFGLHFPVGIGPYMVGYITCDSSDINHKNNVDKIFTDNNYKYEAVFIFDCYVILKSTHHKVLEYHQYHPQTGGIPGCMSRWGTSMTLGLWNVPSQGHVQTRVSPPKTNCSLFERNKRDISSTVD